VEANEAVDWQYVSQSTVESGRGCNMQQDSWLDESGGADAAVDRRACLCTEAGSRMDYCKPAERDLRVKFRHCTAPHPNHAYHAPAHGSQRAIIFRESFRLRRRLEATRPKQPLSKDNQPNYRAAMPVSPAHLHPRVVQAQAQVR
jgi:hypothetical protein